MSVYTIDAAVNSGHLTQSEVHLYGSSRLGIWSASKDLTLVAASNYTRGSKFFELSNHLGNVLVTVSDKKIGVSANGTTIDYYNADVITANDYYPFGSQMPGRKYQQPNGGVPYRYGFNGKENDNEIKGEGNQQDYGMRIYDPRLGRFLSSDPLTKSYPFYSPYQYAGNKPIWKIDVDGLEDGKSVTNAVIEWLESLIPRPDKYVEEKIEMVTGGQAMMKSGADDMLTSQSGGFNYMPSPFAQMRGIMGQLKFYGGAGSIVASGLSVGEDAAMMYFGGLSGTAENIAVNRLRAEGMEIVVANGQAMAMRMEPIVVGEQWGGKGLYSSSQKTTTLLGTRDGYWGRVVKQDGINLASNVENKGAFTHLNIQNHEFDLSTEGGRQGFFDKYNKPFLDAAIQRGDKFSVLDDPFNKNAIFFKGDVNNGLNFFGMERQYLEKKGYSFANGEVVSPAVASTWHAPMLAQ